MRQPRLIIANDRNRVMTSLLLEEAVEIVRKNPSTQFAADMVRAYDTYGDRITGNKKSWLLTIAQQTLNRASRVEAPTTVLGNFDGISALFRLAGSRLKFPKIRFETETGMVVLALAGANSRYHGQVNVSSGHKYGDSDGRFYGRIAPDGTTSVSDPAVLELLRRFAADPAGIAAEYGRRSGSCVFCSLTLTDERSLTVGYGRQCSENYSLPYPTFTELREGRSVEPETGSGDYEAAIAQAELANEPPPAQYSRAFGLDTLLEGAAALAVRDGYLQPRAERLVAAGTDAPWLDND